MLQIYIARRFLEDLFYSNSQQFIYSVAKESVISYKVIQRAPETLKTPLTPETPNVTPNQIKQMQNKAQFLELKILFHTNINNKNSFK